MESEQELSAPSTNGDFHIDAAVSKTLWRVGRPVARAADGLRHNRDRSRHIRQFQNVTRVTLRSEEQGR
jgi:hypothetical protein